MKCPRCGNEMNLDSHRKYALQMCYECGYIEGRKVEGQGGESNFAHMKGLNFNEMAAFLSAGLGLDEEKLVYWLYDGNPHPTPDKGPCFCGSVVLSVFIQIPQSHADGLDDEGGEGAFLPHDGVLYLVDEVVGKSDGFVCCCGNPGDLKSAHNTPLFL